MKRRHSIAHEDQSVANKRPTGILLTAGTVFENQPGALIGTLSASDPDLGDRFTYTTADSRFTIVGDQLWLKPTAFLNFENGATKGLSVTVTDAGGLATSRTVSFVVQDVNEAPTAITLSAKTVGTAVAGAVIGTLGAADPDAGDSATFSVSDARFEVAGGALKLKDGVSLHHDLTPTVPVTVTATDAGGLSRAQVFNIVVSGIVVDEARLVAGAAGAAGANGGAGGPDAAPGADAPLATASLAGALGGTGVADRMSLVLQAAGGVGSGRRRRATRRARAGRARSSSCATGPDPCVTSPTT
jgi:hypothetical protein